MLERLLYTVLEKLFSKYLDVDVSSSRWPSGLGWCVDPSPLSGSAIPASHYLRWCIAQVRLTNLSLKREACYSLGLPLDVLSGYVQSIELSIPWSRLGSSR